MVQRYEESLHSIKEYLALEAQSLEKHEYFQGWIYQMAGGSPEHAIIANNTSAALTLALRGKPCIVYSSDLLIQVEANGLLLMPM